MEMLKGVGDDAVEKAEVHEVFVQEGRLKLPSVDGRPRATVLIVPPVIVGDETSGTELDAVMKMMQHVGVDLPSLARRCRILVLHIRVDNAGQNDLIFETIAHRLPHNVIPLRTHCFMHQCSRMAAETMKRSGLDVINPLFCMSNLVYMGRYWHALSSAVLAIAHEDLEHGWRGGGGVPAPDAREAKDTLVATVWPELRLGSSQLKRDVSWALDQLNGDWSLEQVQHHCKINPITGRPCCSSLAHARSTVKKALCILLMGRLPGIPCVSRWMTCVPVFGWWALGMLCHRLFNRAWVRCWPATVPSQLPDLGGPGAAPDGDGGDVQEQAGRTYGQAVSA